METQAHSPTARARRDAAAPVRSLRWAAAAAALTAAGFVALAVGRADAQGISELQSRIDAAQAEAQGLAAQIEAGGGELVTARAQAVNAATREAQLTSVLVAGQEREAELNVQADRAHRRLVEARERLRRALDALSDRLVAIYKGQTIDETTLLLDSQGYDDLTTRAALLHRIQDADQDLASRVRALRAAVRNRLAAVEDARDAQAAHNAEVASARDQIAAVRARAEAQAAALEQARSQQAAALTSLRSQVDGWTADVQAAQAASAAQAQDTVAGWVGDYAIPAAIVMCESGGSYGAVNASSGAGGAYQILPSTWALYGGDGLPQNASPAEQDRIAAQIWADSGGSAWVCAQ